MRPNLPALKDAQHKIFYFTKDIKINGITVGRGAGNISLNTAVGASALSNNTTGSNNTAFGYAAGNTITSGSYNTFIGYNARGSAGTNIYELAIGHAALGLGSNTTVIGTNGATNSTTIYGALSLPDTTASTTTTTGALKVAGGAGIAGTVTANTVHTIGPYGDVYLTQYGSVFAQGNSNQANVILQASANNLAYGIGLYAANGAINSLYSSGDIYFTTGRTVRNQDIPTGGNTYMSLNTSGVLTLSATTSSTDTLTGALVVSGGAGIAGNLFVGGTINTSTTAVSAAAWTTSGINLKLQARTYTDTSSTAGTIASSYINAIAAPTFASTNAITITNAANLFVDAPVGSANSTLTNAWAIYANGKIRASDFTGTIGDTTTSSGAFTTVTASGQITSTLAIGTAPFVVTSTTNVANLNASLLNGATFAAPGAIGSTTASTGAFTTLSASSTVSGTGFSTYLASPPAIGSTSASTGRFTTIESTIATGTAPFTVASTTNVANLNASSLNGATFAAPGAIGSTTASTGKFTTIESTVATGTAPFTVASTTNVANLNASSLNGATFAAPGAIGSTTASTGAFTTLSATGAITANTTSNNQSYTTTGAGVITITSGTAGSINNMSIGATTASTGRFTTIESTIATGTAPFTVASTTNVANLNASSLNGSTFAAPGAIGSTTASTGAFTTLTASGDVTVSGNLIVNGTTTTINSSTFSVDDKNIELAAVVAGTISATGTIGSITGTGPWTATITNMATTAGLIVGSSITATSGAGTLYGGSPTSVIVASIVSNTSITYTVTGGTIPTAGTITNITTSGSNDVTANGAGITVKAAADKTLYWTSVENRWVSNIGFQANNTALGGTLGNQEIAARFFSTYSGNGGGIDISHFRDAAGSDWTTVGTRTQQKIDSTWMAWQQFNGNGNTYGIAWGTGSSTVSAQAVPEMMRLDSSGNLGIGHTTPSNWYGNSARLVVNQAQNAETILGIGNTTVGASASTALRMVGGTANSYSIDRLNDANGSPWMQHDIGSGVLYRNWTMGGTEKLRLNTTGFYVYNSAMETRAVNTSTRIRSINSSSETTRWPGYEALHYSGNLAGTIDNGGFSVVELFRSRGTEAAKLAVQTNDQLGSVTGWGWDTTGFNDVARINFHADNTFSAADSRGRIEFQTQTGTTLSTRLTIDSSGNVLIGTSTAYTVGVSSSLQVHGTGANAYVTSTRWSADVAPAGYIFGKSRGASVGTRAAVVTNDVIGETSFYGDDATNFVFAASITGGVDSAVSTGVVPGRLMFTTSSAAGVASERMRIDSAGNVGIGTTSPSVRLDVSGATSISGTTTLSGVITANTTTNNQSYTTTGAGTITISSGTVGAINNMSIGSTTASTGAFTTLSASSTVSGTGFSTYLASPPAIGSTTASTGAFTTLSATDSLIVPNTTTLPASPVTGNLRYNTTSNTFEGYSTTGWGAIGGGGGGLTPTAIKTSVSSAYIAAANDLVRCDTTTGAFSITLPLSPADGAQIGIIDVANTFTTNNLTVLPNGNKIENVVQSLILDVSGTYVSLIYMSSTSNWRIESTPGTASTVPTVFSNVMLDDISNQFDGSTSVFNITANSVSINTLIDSKDIDVFVNGLKLSPYVDRLTYPWLTPYDSGTGFRVRNLPSTTDAATLVGKLIIYKAPFISSTSSVTVRYISATRQKQQYPFNANTIALGD